MTERRCPASALCNCPTCCDILEGEGGAGGFSDGKKTYSLRRGTQLEDVFDPLLESHLKEIDDTIVRFSPWPGVWYDPPAGQPKGLDLSRFSVGSYPLRHIGSDGVRGFITQYSEHLQSRGVRMRLRQEVISVRPSLDLTVRDVAEHRHYQVKTDVLVIATGIAGWDCAEAWVRDLGVEPEDGPAGVGMRYEAFSSLLDPLFNWFYDFKLERGRLRSFCCNHHGQVINENHRGIGICAVNGDSSLGAELRTSMSNMAILAKLTEVGAKSKARMIARRVNDLVGGGTATQWSTDFLAGHPSVIAPWVRTNEQASGGVDIGSAFPADLRDEFRQFIDEFELALGIPQYCGVITAPELKYAGHRIPVDLRTFRLRGQEGVYVIGNATGVLDSFVSAALTGIVAAQAIIKES
jgi:uncharacterized FAD-dependent dehydrogenase